MRKDKHFGAVTALEINEVAVGRLNKTLKLVLASLIGLVGMQEVSLECVLEK